VGIADDLGDRQRAAAFEHAKSLGQTLGAIGNFAQHRAEIDEIDGFAIEFEVGGIPNQRRKVRGARVGGALVGYAVFFDLPDTMTGMRTGQLDDLFVIQAARGRKVGQALIDALAAEGERRGWQQIRWMVPEKPVTARRFAERLARSGGWLTYTVALARK